MCSSSVLLDMMVIVPRGSEGRGAWPQGLRLRRSEAASSEFEAELVGV
jgi:hypothetical protein